MATAALVLGIVGICLFWTFGFGMLLGILAVVFGLIGLSNARKVPGRPSAGRAIAGIATGAVALVVGFGFLAIFVWAANDISDDFEGIDGGINSDPSDGICNANRYLQDPDC